MPSPFPGMDPFIEGQIWEDFHSTFLVEVRMALMSALAPRYVARIEHRLYLEHPVESDQRSIRPDVTVVAPGRLPGAGGGTALLVPPPGGVVPVMLPLPVPEEVREPYLEIRLREGGEVVAVIELLSPANKRAGSNGHREYLEKRALVLRSNAHLVELDLLRGGARLPMRGELPPADCYAIVSRKSTWPLAQVWPWSLRQPLPAIPIPLAGDDPDVLLDLQAVFTTAYDRAGYQLLLDYRRAPTPPLPEEEFAWMRETLAAARDASTAAG